MCCGAELLVFEGCVARVVVFVPRRLDPIGMSVFHFVRVAVGCGL